MLELKNIKKKYDGDWVLNGFSKSFRANSIYLLTGSNGSGKTTLLKIIRGILNPDEGEINAILEPKNCKIAYVDANSRSFLHRLSVKENLFYFMALDKQKRDFEKIKFFLSLFGLDNLLERNFALLSAGQMQMVAIVRGLLEEPTILILDEAMSNLDKKLIQKAAIFFESFVSKENRLMIICSHSHTLPIKFKETIDLQ